jgi:hypothetical protein
MGEGVGKRGEERCGACNGTGAVEIGKGQDPNRNWEDDELDRFWEENADDFAEQMQKEQMEKERNLKQKESCNCQDPAHVKITDPGAPIPEASEIEEKEQYLRNEETGKIHPLVELVHGGLGDIKNRLSALETEKRPDHVTGCDCEACQAYYAERYPRTPIENIPDSVENGDEKKSLWDRMKARWKK